MGIKEQILEGLKPALTAQIKSDVDAGRIKQPVNFNQTMDVIWRTLRMNVQTAGAIIAFGIKKEDVGAIVKQVFVDLKIEIK